MTNIDELFKRAIALQRRGDPADNEQIASIYAQILELDADHFDALQLLATLFASQGAFATARPLFEKAVSLNAKNPKVLNNYGFVLSKLGDLQAALQIYQRAIELDSKYIDAINNLANLYQQLFQFKDAIRLYDQVTQLDKRFFQAFFNKGLAYFHMREFEQSSKAYAQAIKIKPDYWDAYLNRAITLKELGLYSQAEGIFEMLLKNVHGPALFEVHNNYSNLLQTLGNYKLALHHCDQAIMVNPRLASLYSNRGNILQSLGNNQEANLCYALAIELEPFNPDFYSNRGNSQQKLHFFDLALHDYERALVLAPAHLQANYNRANLFKAQNFTERAIESYQLCLHIDPMFADAHNNLGNIYKEQNNLEWALNAYSLALKAEPNHLEALNNKGVSQQRSQDLAGAVMSFRQVLEKDKTYTKAWVNLAITLFLQGELSEAWRLYEYRLRDAEFIPKPFNTPKPMLSKDKLSKAGSAHVLLWSEQGVGDSVMFASMFLTLREKVGRLSVLVDERLIPIFERSFGRQGIGAITFIPQDSLVDHDAYDFHLPMGSLGYLLGMDEARIKSLKPAYLSPKPDKVARNSELVCGISWKSTNPKNGADRSIDLITLIEHIRVPGVTFLSLQYLSTEHDKVEVERARQLRLITTYGVDNLNDLDGLTGLIASCDLVISVDNTTVHLSAALGRPTWVLLPVVADWRWMSHRSDSPWYPSVNLFRQSVWGEWGDVLYFVRNKLDSYLLENNL
jgi:tetratricopeptide (TPR) repeat protein